MKILETRGTTFHVRLHFNSRTGTYYAECYLKRRCFIRFATLNYKTWPQLSRILQDTFQLNCKSRRPFKLGQDIDGSCVAPIIHIFSQYCRHQNWDARLVYNELMEYQITSQEFDKSLEHAEWQGVQTIHEWHDVHVSRLMDALTELSCDQSGIIFNRILSNN